MLAVGHLAQGDLALGVAQRRDIDHQSEGIAALRRNEHTYPPIAWDKITRSICPKS